MQVNEMITSQNEKEMLVYGLTRVMYADGTLSDSENAFLVQITNALGCEKIDLNSIENNNKKISFADTKTCMYFLTQAVQLCFVDGKYDSAEREELLLICGEMGISEEAFIKVEKWVEEGIEWNNRGMDLLNLK